MKKTILLLSIFCVLLTGCSSKTETGPEVTDGAPTQTAEISASLPPEASPEASAEISPDATGEPEASEAPAATAEVTPAPEMPAQQTANPTPTPTPVPDESAHLSDMYVDIIKSNNYFMKAKVENESGINEFAVSFNGDNSAMETVSDGIVYNTVIKDGITYMIDHQNKLVITSGAEVSSSASNMAGDSLSTEGITFTTKGSGQIGKETMAYDEYKTPSGGTMRFYFRGSALAGIESIDNGQTTLYIIEEISAGHRSDMHVIPDSYQLLDMAALGG